MNTFVISNISDSDTLSLVSYPRQNVNNNSVRIDLSAVTPTRFRGFRDIDISSWDDEATLHLRSTFHPSGELCDYLARCRRPIGFRKLPNSGCTPQTTIRRLSKTTGVIWFVRDPCGISCIIFTWLLILYAEFVIDFVILMQTQSTLFFWFGGIVYHVLISLAIYSHYKAVTLDPGSIPLGTATQAMAKYIQKIFTDASVYVVRCTKCLSIRPIRAHHCRICQRCVRKMDHHCPWVNNCVGEGNQKYFILFTFYICFSSFFSIYMGAHFLSQCITSDCKNLESTISSWLGQFNPVLSIALSLGLMGEALIFGLFTFFMCITQLCAISYDETGIENIKKEQQTWERSTKQTNFAKTFGSSFSWEWFNPFTAPKPLSPIIPGLSDDLPYSLDALSIDDPHTVKDELEFVRGGCIV